MKSIVTTCGLLMVAWCSMAAPPEGSSLRGIDARIWNGLSSTTWIAQGEGERIAYIFIDPNCPYSRDLFKKAQQIADPRATQIRWLPVGVLAKTTEDSRFKAATAVKGGKKALEAVMRGDMPAEKPSPLELSQVDRTAEFLGKEIEKHVPAGVPKVVYVKDNGKEIRVFTGVPPHAELARLLR